MRYVEAPHPHRRLRGDGPSIFLGGGITGCEDWQRRACEMLGDAPVVVLNPRRARYEPANGDFHEQQVGWEQRHLGLADVTLFWFAASDPRVTVQPIALLELGVVLAEAGSSSPVGAPEPPCTGTCAAPVAAAAGLAAARRPRAAVDARSATRHRSR